MMTELKCPYCDFKVSIHIPDDAGPEELNILKECPCGKAMETAQEIETRMKRRGIKEKYFYTLIRHQKKNIAVKKKGIEFDKRGLTFYAYQTGKGSPVCFVIDPETGRALDTIYHPIDTVYRHISPKRVEEFKHKRECNGGAYYAGLKKEFQGAEKVYAIKEE